MELKRDEVLRGTEKQMLQVVLSAEAKIETFGEKYRVSLKFKETENHKYYRTIYLECAGNYVVYQNPPFQVTEKGGEVWDELVESINVRFKEFLKNS